MPSASSTTQRRTCWRWSCGIGLAVSFALGRVVASQMPGVAGLGALSLAGVALVLGAAALLASFLPARRAARMDPLAALRHE